MTPLAVGAAILIGLLLLDVIGACVSGIGATGFLWRLFLSKRHGSRFIAVPDDLQTAIANDLIHEGSELIVGFENEWDGGTVRSFAVSPQVVKAEAGTVLRILKVTRRHFELKRVA